MSASAAIPWIVDRPEHARPGGDRYAPLLTATRRFLDVVCAADAPEDITRAAIEDIERLTAALAPHGVPRLEAPAGNRPDLTGEGHPLSPTYRHLRVVAHVGPRDGDSDARVRRQFRHNARGLAGFHLRRRAGSACLAGPPALPYRLSQRGLPLRDPVGVELTVSARIDRIEGRKIWTTGEMRNGDVLLTEAQGLFSCWSPDSPSLDRRDTWPSHRSLSRSPR